MTAPDHLVIAPILIPFIAGAVMLLYDESQRRAKLALSLASTTALLAVTILLVARASAAEASEVGVYLLGDWPVPVAIVLVVDRLSAMLLLLGALLALPALVYSAAGWHRQGQHFHSLFQFFLMGLNGTFLTGDLFNLFVFFEVLLAASYGLLLHGSGRARVLAGLHFIALNLAASLLFLIAAAIIYGVTGTLNMADLARLVGTLPEHNQPLFHAGVAFLGIVFLVKAAIWPLGFWLPGAYGASSAPVVAMFAIATKVGVYAVLRLGMLLTGPEAGASAGFGAGALAVMGMATIVFGALGALASQELGRVTAHLLMISSGTVLAAVGFTLLGGSAGILAGALYYLLGSTLAAGALFLLAEPMNRADGGAAAMLALTAQAYGADTDEDVEPEVGYTISGSLTATGFAFALCCMALAGLPPLPGFIGKFAILDSAFGLESAVSSGAWWLLGILFVSGFATLIALARLGMQTIWATETEPPRVLVIEIAPVIALVALTVLLAVKAEAVMGYVEDTALALLQPESYVRGVIEAPRAVDGETAE